MVKQLGLWLIDSSCFLEAFVGDNPQLAQTLTTRQTVALIEEVQAAPIPALGLRQVAEGGAVLVGVAKVEGDYCPPPHRPQLPLPSYGKGAGGLGKLS